MNVDVIVNDVLAFVDLRRSDVSEDTNKTKNQNSAHEVVPLRTIHHVNTIDNNIARLENSQSNWAEKGRVAGTLSDSAQVEG